MKRRAPAVAGTFYPGDPDVLKAQIHSYLDAATDSGITPKALIGPHAGTIYSGPIAGSAYKAVQSVREQIKKVVLLGPAHHVPLQGLAASSADMFLTPLGEIPVDQESVRDLTQLSQVAYNGEAHLPEHSLELHLPFLQEVLGEFKLIPFVVGFSKAEEVAEVLERTWGGTETLIVVSSDLSHYLPYESARRIDDLTTKSIEALRWEDLDTDQAFIRFVVCCRRHVNII
jgi:AmmeMemoRadiSam system protein B